MNEPQRATTCRITYIGGPTVLLEVGTLRLLTDPTFDPAGTRYTAGPVELIKATDPSVTVTHIGKLDAVLLSHDHHDDNLDHAGRALLAGAEHTLTTTAGGRRLGGNAVGLAPWEVFELAAGEERVRVTAVPARHGPEGMEEVVGEVTGFMLEWSGQKHGALYISGDTVLYEGLREIPRRFQIGTALLHLGAAEVAPLGPVRLTLGGAEAAQLTRELEIKTVIPIHYEGWVHFGEGRREAERAFSRAGLSDRVLWLNPGTPTELLI